MGKKVDYLNQSAMQHCLIEKQRTCVNSWNLTYYIEGASCYKNRPHWSCLHDRQVSNWCVSLL